MAVKMQHKKRRAPSKEKLNALRKLSNEQRIDNDREASQVAFKRFEAAALKEMHHQNIDEWFHTIETTTNIYLVLEFCGEATLLDYIFDRKGFIEDKAKEILVQLLSAVLYMHSKRMSQSFSCI